MDVLVRRKKIQKILLFSLLSSQLIGCQLGYYMTGAYNQMSILAKREPIETSLSKQDLTEEQKRKLRLAFEAKEFAESELGLKKTKTYSTFSRLDRSSVTWVLNVAEPFELKNYEWSYPIVGRMPYKGFFTEHEALAEQTEFISKGYDTFVRGVSAYSTLGWFNDPILSTFLNYKDHDLVNTISHELTHVTLYIKNSADFNERLASFVGDKGMRRFYLKKEGPSSPTLKQLELELADEKIFRAFINQQIIDLKVWFQDPAHKNIEQKEKRLNEINAEFTKTILPQLKTGNYVKFKDRKLNNAYLNLYSTYNGNFEEFERVYALSQESISVFLEKIKALENSKDPMNDLKFLN